MAKSPANKIEWTDEMIAFVKNNIDVMPYKKIAQSLNFMSPTPVKTLVKKLGLKRSEEAVNKFKMHFKRGRQPWNKNLKGLRMSPATEFKKGHSPANTKYDGCITVRKDKRGVPYKHIRINKSKWIYYHRYMWEKYYGAIPDKHVVRFKNGNTLDCRIENLEMVSMAQNCRRNENKMKASESMKQVWKNDTHLKSDKYIAYLIAPNDADLRMLILEDKAIIDIARNNAILKRRINELRK